LGEVFKEAAMKVITDEHCTGYSHEGHPERPERVRGILERLRGQTALPIAWNKPGPYEEASLLRAHGAALLAAVAAGQRLEQDPALRMENSRETRSSSLKA